MGMSTYVEGFRPPDAKWKKMKKVWDACQAAGTSVPDEVDDFFDGEDPDPSGIKVQLGEKDGVQPYNEEMREGYEIDISKLPKNITRVRFVNSY